jgi:hypothetical protein
VPAIIHPGAVIHYWDHLVITLREDAAGAEGGAGAAGRAGPAGAAGATDAPVAAGGPSNATAVETGFLSLYAITYSPTLGAGHVAVVEAGDLLATFSDDPGLGERQQARLVGMGDGRAALRRPPILASFERLPYGADGFGYRMSSDAHEIEARWEATDPPFWVDGQGGAFHAAEDIWAIMIGARRASLIIDGAAVPGVPFEDDVWVPKLGRSLSSAHGAFAEVRVEPVRPGRATGSDPAEPR